MEGAAPAAVAATESAAVTPESQTNAGTQDQAGQEQAQKSAKDVQEEIEEIKIGRESFKVPKNLARVVKDLERGFHQKAQESATIQKQVRTFMEQARANPDLFFQETGIDPDQYSQGRLAKVIEKQMMSPEQRELMEAKAKLDAYEKEKKELEERQKTEKQSAEEQKLSNQLRNEIFTAWQGSGLPPHPLFGQMIAREMVSAEARGENLNAAQAAAIVKEDFRAVTAEILKTLDAETLEQILGSEPLSKWREFDVKRVTAKSAPTQKRDSEALGKPQQAKKPMNEKEWREYMNRLSS